MANEAGKNERRLAITFWDGVNAIVDKSIAKAQELLHVENARSNIIGTLEKREGQIVLGTNTSGGRFSARENYDIAFVSTGFQTVNGLYRLTGSGEPYASYTISVYDNLGVIDVITSSSNNVTTYNNSTLYIKVVDNAVITEVPMYGVSDRNTTYIDNTDYSDVNIYQLADEGGVWGKMVNSNANNLPGAPFTHTVIDGKVFFSNGRGLNRYIDQDGVTVFDSTYTLGNLYNSPKSKIVNAYKGRIYLANYTWEGIHYGNTILVSSFPLGILALLEGDVTAAGSGVWTLPVTDNTYIYTDSGANLYEVWRINTKIADIKVSAMDDLNIYVNATDITWANTSSDQNATGTNNTSTDVTGLSINAVQNLAVGMAVTGSNIQGGTTIAAIVSATEITLSQPTLGVTTAFHFIPTGFLSQDQFFVKGSVTGPKVYRWPNNPTLSGSDIKQYNTFKLSGSDESDVTMMVNVGNVMIIANRSLMASWNDSTINYFDLGIGCVSPRGFAKAYGALYFLHYTGIYATSGGMPNIISTPIKPYIQGATKAGLESAVVGKKDRSVFFAIGDSTIYYPDGSVKSVLPDVCLEYNITQQNWYVHTNVPASCFETFIDDNDPGRLLLSDSNTKDIKAFLEGYTDDGDEIFFRADTQALPIASNVEELSNPNMVMIESEQGSSMECYVAIDTDEFYPLEGQAEKGITRLKFHGKDGGTGSPPIGHYVTLSFRDGSKQRCKIGRVAITFVPAGTSNP